MKRFEEFGDIFFVPRNTLVTPITEYMSNIKNNRFHNHDFHDLVLGLTYAFYDPRMKNACCTTSDRYAPGSCEEKLAVACLECLAYGAANLGYRRNV